MRVQTKLTPERTAWYSMIGNLLLSAGKLAAGLWGHSSAMVADAVHSASDVCSTVVVLFALRISKKKPDKNHQYGHERFESLAALLLSFMLAMTGLGIGWQAVQTILTLLSDEASVVSTPTMPALAAAIISIIVKECMYRVTANVARREKSDALMADAWHHRSDALSSVGSMIGIGAAMLGVRIMDPIAGLVICGMILKSAYDIVRPAIGKLTDEACSLEHEHEIRQLIMSVEGVQHIDMLQTRCVGAHVYVDVEIAADGELTLNEAHGIAEKVHDLVEQSCTYVKHCMVHVNPLKGIKSNKP